MVVTEVTLALSLAMIGMLLSLVAGTWGGKTYRMLLPSIAIFGAVIPICLALVYTGLSPFIIIMDWAGRPIVPWPPITGFVSSWAGGFFGLKAGGIWERDEDKSCFQCLLLPISLLVVGSVLVLFLP